MDITVKFIGSLRSIVGKSKINIMFEDAVSIREATRRIVEKLPTLKRVLIDPDRENSRPNVLIIVNGKEISVLNGLETMLKDGDEVVFVPVSHGG
jgi:molybdopterin synthase sulfur carrier subunit